MIESKSFGSKAFKVINAIILILLAFSCFYPLWYTFCVSISSKAAAEGGLVTGYPIGPNVKSYSLIMVIPHSGIPSGFPSNELSSEPYGPWLS